MWEPKYMALLIVSAKSTSDWNRFSDNIKSDYCKLFFMQGTETSLTQETLLSSAVKLLGILFHLFSALPGLSLIFDENNIPLLFEEIHFHGLGIRLFFGQLRYFYALKNAFPWSSLSPICMAFSFLQKIIFCPAIFVSV